MEEQGLHTEETAKSFQVCTARTQVRSSLRSHCDLSHRVSAARGVTHGLSVRRSPLWRLLKHVSDVRSMTIRADFCSNRLEKWCRNYRGGHNADTSTAQVMIGDIKQFSVHTLSSNSATHHAKTVCSFV